MIESDNLFLVIVVEWRGWQRGEWLEHRDCDRYGLDSKPIYAILLCF